MQHSYVRSLHFLGKKFLPYCSRWCLKYTVYSEYTSVRTYIHAYTRVHKGIHKCYKLPQELDGNNSFEIISFKITCQTTSVEPHSRTVSETYLQNNYEITGKHGPKTGKTWYKVKM
jgi:hypothetical protein